MFQILGSDFFSFLFPGRCGLFTFYVFIVVVLLRSFAVVVRINLKAKSLLVVLFVCNRLNSQYSSRGRKEASGCIRLLITLLLCLWFSSPFSSHLCRLPCLLYYTDFTPGEPLQLARRLNIGMILSSYIKQTDCF